MSERGGSPGRDWRRLPGLVLAVAGVGVFASGAATVVDAIGRTRGFDAPGLAIPLVAGATLAGAVLVGIGAWSYFERDVQPALSVLVGLAVFATGHVPDAWRFTADTQVQVLVVAGVTLGTAGAVWFGIEVVREGRWGRRTG